MGGAAAYPAAIAPAVRPVLALVGGLAVLSLVAGVLRRWPVLVQVALMLLVASYAGALTERGDVDAWAPVFAALLLVGAELGYASLEPPATRRGATRMALLVAGAAVATAALGALLLGTAVIGSGSLAEYAFGFAAAALAVAVIAWLAWATRLERARARES